MTPLSVSLDPPQEIRIAGMRESGGDVENVLTA
jgi:hypothetical protein